MGSLSTHVLDTANGRPAAQVSIRLNRLSPTPEQCFVGETNQDGRVDGPLLDDEHFVPGQYELVFEVGDYFARSPLADDAGEFLDDVVVRFKLSRDEHYHVPLLVTPWSYSTYRGS